MYDYQIYYRGIGSIKPYMYTEGEFRMLLKINENSLNDPLTEQIEYLLERIGAFYILN